MTCFTCGSRVDVIDNKCPRHRNTDINGNGRIMTTPAEELRHRLVDFALEYSNLQDKYPTYETDSEPKKKLYEVEEAELLDLYTALLLAQQQALLEDLQKKLPKTIKKLDYSDAAWGHGYNDAAESARDVVRKALQRIKGELGEGDV